MKRFLLTAILGMTVFTAVQAQYVLHGKITNSEGGEPLPGATVMLQNTLYATVCDVNGDFSFKNVKPATYLLTVSYLGFKTETRSVEILKNTEQNIKLQPSAIMQEGVVISAMRASETTPVTRENIGKKALNAANFGQDLPILISQGISTVATSDAGNGMGYTAFRIRGTDMTRINVTINGIPLNDPESHNVFWVDLPDFASSTDNIQIQRGVGTSTNGAAAFGASINLQSSHTKTEPYGEISSAYGSFNTLKNTLSMGTGLINNHFTMDGRISKLSSDGFINRASSNLFSYYLSGAYISKKDMLRLNIFSGKEKTYQAWDGIPSDILKTNRTYNGQGKYTDNFGKEKYYDNQTDNYVQTHYQALYSHQFNSKLFLNAALHRTDGAGYYEQYRENDKLADYGIDPINVGASEIKIGDVTIPAGNGLIKRCDLIRQKHLKNTLNGITWSLNQQGIKINSAIGGSYNQYDGNHFGRVIWTQFAGNSEINHEWYRSKAVKKDFNLFAKSEYAVNKSVSLWADVQFRHIDYDIKGIDDDQRNITQHHTYDFFNPKAGIRFKISSNQSIFTSVSVAHREPNRDNLVDADPTKPVPTPEKLYDAELGYSFATAKLAFNANAYYMYYIDQLALTGAINDVGAAVMVNVPKSYRAGIELSGKALIAPRLSWEPSATFSINKIRSFTEYIDDWDNWGQQKVSEHTHTTLAFSPAVIANSNLTWKPTNKLNISLISKYVGKQYIDNTQSEDRILHDYFVNNLLLNYTTPLWKLKEVEFSFMINNLLNEKYEANAWVYRYYTQSVYQKLDGYFPQAGINVMGGVKIKL